MTIPGAEWRAVIEPHFAFLHSHGFGDELIEDESSSATRVTYKSNRTGIAVIYSVEFDRSELEVSRLLDGELPEYPVWITPEGSIDVFPFDGLLALRAPEAARRASELHGLADDQIDHQLDFWADALRKYFRDLLEGDLGVLAERERQLQQEAAANPPVVTIWLPDDATPSDEHAARTRASAGLPPGVGVLVQHYRRSAGSP